MFINVSQAIEHYLNENDLEEKIFNNFWNYSQIANQIFIEK